MPIDLYAKENEKEDKEEDKEMTFEKLRHISEENFITPMGINPGNNFISRSKTIIEEKKDNNEDNNIINIPSSKTLEPYNKKFDFRKVGVFLKLKI